MTMGTASTMTGLADVLGMCLPGTSSIPAPDASHVRMCSAAGRRAVDMVWEDLTPTRIMTRGAFQNAINVAMAMGCSTNAVIHILAMARRAGHDIGPRAFRCREPQGARDRQHPPVRRQIPDGGLLLRRRSPGPHVAPHRPPRSQPDHCQRPDVGTGARRRHRLQRRRHPPAGQPHLQEGALALLKGNIAPDGCVIKPSACDPRFLKHKGKALVFDSYEELKKNINRDDLDVTVDTVLVLRNAGPQGGPACPSGACCRSRPSS